ncbi:MAG: sulfatase/phosphatase domain-containing protein [Verrucomicrobiota bacterium]
MKWAATPGGRSAFPVSGVDVFPTLCAMAGTKAPKHQAVDGRDLTPILTGKAKAFSGGRALFWHFPAYLDSYRGITDEQRDPLFRTRPCSIIRRGPWKLHQYFEDDALELYNLEEDIGETVNLAESNPEKATALLLELRNWREGIGAPVPEKKEKAEETPGKR